VTDRLNQDLEQLLRENEKHCSEIQDLYFNPMRRSERERKVTLAFLRCLGMTPQFSDVRTSTEEPPDVLFNRCCFEVTMALPQGTDPPGDRLKQERAKINQARSAQSLEPIRTRETGNKWLNSSDVLEAVKKSINVKRKYHQGVREKLDLLIYLNYYGRQIDTSENPPLLANVDCLNFRSISLTCPPVSVIIHATKDAPLILQRRKGEYLSRLRIKNLDDMWESEKLVRYVSKKEAQALSPSLFVSSLAKQTQTALGLPDPCNLDIVCSILGTNDPGELKLIKDRIGRPQARKLQEEVGLALGWMERESVSSVLRSSSTVQTIKQILG